MAMKIRKGDKGVVTTGRDKGKAGTVLRAMPRESRLLVQGVNLVKRHTRPSATGGGGIIEKEAPIHVSNVAHVDPKDGKPTRLGFKTPDDVRKEIGRASCRERMWKEGENRV